MSRARRSALRWLLAGVVAVAGLAVAPHVSAEPATPVRYPRAGTVTTFSGLAFDTCTAPSLTTMQAWRASPYRAVGVYVGGVNRSCAQPQLTSDWVAATRRMGWRLLPIYVGRQASCSTRESSVKIRLAVAAEQGREEAADAVTRARALGMRAGSAIYSDIEHYDARRARCRDGVLAYLSGWTRGLHRRGYLAGVYAHQDSGALHLAQNYDSTRQARPDALWIARWDLDDSLRGWPTVPDAMWSRAQRAKQFRGDHLETWGGVRLNIDSDRLATPVATVARGYRVSAGHPVAARTGPGRAYRTVRSIQPGSTVGVLCQATGARAAGSRIWDKVAGGLYVPDGHLSTPGDGAFTRGLPGCRFGYQVRAPERAPVHRRPGSARAVVGTLPDGALARVICQRRGSVVGPTAVWNRLADDRWVSDRYVATAARRGFTSAIPRC